MNAHIPHGPSCVSQKVTGSFIRILAIFAMTSLNLFAEDMGPELIINGEMESIGNWEGANCGGPTVPDIVENSGEEVHGGDNSLHVMLERQQGNEFPMVTTGAFSTEEGKTYKVSFWCKVIQGSFNAKIRVGADNDYANLVGKSLIPSGDWELVETEYTETAGGPSARLCFMGAEDGPCEIFLDDVSVREIAP